ncbi:hypothetical protein [Thioclava sp.]|uniref:hypothetical protein n=1 Tax=Thioclava sp. TaxID=1933450 RepID=UPI003AA87C5A
MKSSKQRQVGAFGGTLSLLVSVLFLSRGFSAVDARFLPDDTYYTLSIARNIFEGHGATMDGIISTSGFQPLIALFELPLFSILTQPEALTLGAVAISAIFGALAAALAGMLVLRETEVVWAGFLSGALIALSPVISANALNGLETSLAAALLLWVLWLLQGADRDSKMRDIVLIGLVAGFSILARIDSVLLLLPAGLWGLRQFGAARTAIVALVAAITVLPWVLYCMRFGSPVPESGAAVRQIVNFYITSGLRTLPEMNVPLIPTLGEFLVPRLPQIGIFAITGTLILALAQFVRIRRMSLSAVLLLSSISYIAFYAFYLPAFWFFDRYLNPVFIFCAILLSIILAIRAERVETCPLCRIVNTIAVIVLLIGPSVSIYLELMDREPPRPDRGYTRQARDVLQRLPDGAVLAAMQSGALTWWASSPPYAHAGIRVVNLDGVVNRHAKDAIHNHRLAAYLQSIHATHFSDWPLNAYMLNTYAGQEAQSVLGDRIFQSPPYTGFDLYRIALTIERGRSSLHE